MAKGPEMDLSSFMDIMTCILGILILIILLTGIDATQINVLVATPQEDTGDDKRPIFFECRNNELFLISFDKIKSIIDAKTEEIAGRVAGNESEFIKQAASTILKIDGQQIGFSHAMIGRYFLMPDPDVPGYRIENYRQEGSDSW